MALRVIVVQHAEKERLPGDPPLTPLGQRQAEATADHLTSITSVAAVWSSPLRRARATAEPIARAAGLPIVEDGRLRERMNWDGVEPATVDEFLVDWGRASTDRAFVPRSGDSSAIAGQRFVAALDSLAEQHPSGTVVVVAHGGVTVDGMRTLFSDDVVTSFGSTLITQGVPCCALTTLEHDQGHWQLQAIATTDHVNRVEHRPG